MELSSGLGSCGLYVCVRETHRESMFHKCAEERIIQRVRAVEKKTNGTKNICLLFGGKTCNHHKRRLCAGAYFNSQLYNDSDLWLPWRPSICFSLTVRIVPMSSKQTSR